MKNEDQSCFLVGYLSSYLHPVEDHRNTPPKYILHMPTLCVQNVEFPMKVKDIPKFENLLT